MTYLYLYLYCVFSGGGSSCGKILQRFPKTDWPGCHFTPGIELVSHLTQYQPDYHVIKNS